MSNLTQARARQLAHNKIRQLMLEGDLDEAHFQAEEAITEFGPHLGLLCDKAACEYEIGYFYECEQSFKQIEKEMEKADGLISLDSKRRTYVFLSKVAEELGEYEKTLNFLNRARELATHEEDLKWVLLQELRVLSFINRPQGLSEKYLLVEERKALSENLNIETLHCLMWTEWRLFGWSHAETRFRQLLVKQLNTMDFRLINRDFLEISLFSGQLKTDCARLAIQNLRSVSDILPYDDALLYISSGLPVRMELQVAVGVSKMMRLRVLLLGMLHEQDQNLKEELRKKYLFLIESVSKKSRDILMALLPIRSEEEKLNLELQSSSRALIYKDQLFKLTKLQVKLLTSMATLAETSLEALSKDLWEQESDPGLYDRLRMLIYRTNSLIEPRTGCKALMVTKTRVSLDPRFQIRVG